MKEQKLCNTAEGAFSSILSVSFPHWLISKSPVLSEQAVYHLTSQVSVFIKVTTSAVIKERHTACRHGELNEMLSSLIYTKPTGTDNKEDFVSLISPSYVHLISVLLNLPHLPWLTMQRPAFCPCIFS